MLLGQEGRCFYSGVLMECVVPNSHWRMSLERLDNNLGYSLDNCVLPAAEFNTSDFSKNKKGCYEVYGTAQWSRRKVAEVPFLRIRDVDANRLAEAVEEAHSSSLFPYFREAFCDQHGEYARRSDGPLSKTKVYKRSYTYQYRRTLRGTLSNMLSGARRRSKF
ncbi:unnamed protein product [Prorocentrum cordatum]|uniref:Uncharacterized protein n=1 Tax=Prorocentrum cordatum TaxID=2364126 RepID=A0ABN9QRZ5_9DINO|nr:unnamed protein product [Polarella glacialis]